MMHGREKSGPVGVAGKRANKAERSAAEPVERRAGAEGNAGQNRAHRAQNRRSASQALARIRQASRSVSPSRNPRWEPYAGKPHVRICAGGAR